MAIKTLYTATATATGGREGHVETSDGTVKFDLTMPKGLGGAEKPGTTNPEQLFASGYAACFAGAAGLVAKKMGVQAREVKVTVRASIGQDPADGGFGLAAEIDLSLPGVDRETAQKVVEAAHQVCPYSKATRGNMDVKLAVV